MDHRSSWVIVSDCKVRILRAPDIAAEQTDEHKNIEARTKIHRSAKLEQKYTGQGSGISSRVFPTAFERWLLQNLGI